jgi:hypothetical protein
MLPGEIFERFANGSPLTVMLRGTVEDALRPRLLKQLFAETARRQSTHKLSLFTPNRCLTVSREKAAP